MLMIVSVIAFADELEARVLQPSREAQAFVDQHPYLTRMYVSMREEFMNKDPIFSFRAGMDDVSNVHTAVAVPKCIDGEPLNELEVTLGDGTVFTHPHD